MNFFRLVIPAGARERNRASRGSAPAVAFSCAVKAPYTIALISTSATSLSLMNNSMIEGPFRLAS